MAWHIDTAVSFLRSKDQPEKFAFVLVTDVQQWRKPRRRKVKVIELFKTREEGERAKKKRLAKCFGPAADADYRVLGPVQLTRFRDELEAEEKERRSAGSKKAAASRKKNKKKAQFVTCPRCGAKTKLLYSEMGGFQTRRCQRGHLFTFDKWIADRPFLIGDPYSW